MKKRVFILVMDSFGVGEMPDSADYNDEGSNTLKAVSSSPLFNAPNLKKLGLFNVAGVDCCSKEKHPLSAYARLGELSKGKDTTIGHWEIAGIVSQKPLPTYPNGFPAEVIEKFEKATGRKTLCNLPYSGTEVIKKYGQESIDSGALIVYTSADSVFQIAVCEDVVPVEELYRYCQIARDILQGEHGVGRVIARPFIVQDGQFVRTSNRHDFSLKPPRKTMLDYVKESKFDCISVGKIVDIFSGEGITEFYRTKDNFDGMEKTIEISNKNFNGLCFVNLVDFDMKYGHRNDIDGYAKAVTDFDVQLGEFLNGLKKDDLVIITADHGCDPATPSTDHSREYVFALNYGKNIKQGVDLGTRMGFCDIAKTVLEYLGIENDLSGSSYLNQIKAE